MKTSQDATFLSFGFDICIVDMHRGPECLGHVGTLLLPWVTQSHSQSPDPKAVELFKSVCLLQRSPCDLLVLGCALFIRMWASLQNGLGFHFYCHFSSWLIISD